MAACNNAGQSSMGNMFCIKSVSMSSSFVSTRISVAVMVRGNPALAAFVLFRRVLCVKSLMVGHTHVGYCSFGLRASSVFFPVCVHFFASCGAFWILY